MELRLHSYRYYPYERALASREVLALPASNGIEEKPHGLKVFGPVTRDACERLVYFSEMFDGVYCRPTLQGKLERVNGKETRRQSTRYSVHGLHEYRGKFNPQIARAILNILGVSRDDGVLDPFCGSGTTLVECAHIGVRAVGTDINPLAVFVANAKLSALRMDPSVLKDELRALLKRWKTVVTTGSEDEERADYLRSWFDPAVLTQIEAIRSSISHCASDCRPIFLTMASNLLREYSLQDPHDLRIRRRKRPLPDIPFIVAFESAAAMHIERLESAHEALGRVFPTCRAVLGDSRSWSPGYDRTCSEHFDAAVTSPPYATALPYIDTQRLSLVWLGLATPAAIPDLDSRLVGSREARGAAKKGLLTDLNENARGLPEAPAAFCRMLQGALTEEDGFRRRAVPGLLYRYFAGMSEAFRSIKACMRSGAPFALVVGGNHSVLGGKRYDIHTPRHLSEIAQSNGWTHEETIPLDTYVRYGYHASNAVRAESLVILRAP